jgi:hypothetical protein
MISMCLSVFGAGSRIRTYNILITSQAFCQLELYRRKLIVSEMLYFPAASVTLGRRLISIARRAMYCGCLLALLVLPTGNCPARSCRRYRSGRLRALAPTILPFQRGILRKSPTARIPLFLARHIYETCCDSGCCTGHAFAPTKCKSG